MTPTNNDTNASTQDGNTSSGSTSGAGDSFEPITSQEQLNKLVGDRIQRERAKFGDYDDLRAKAAKLDEIEAANKSELERATEAAQAVAAERDQAKAEALRLRVAVEHGISLDDAALFLTGQDEDTIRAQAKRLADREADRKKNGNVVPPEGRVQSQSSGDPRRAFVRQLTKP